MGSIRRIEKQNNQDVDLDKIIDEYSSYIKTVINNMAGKSLSYEDKEEVLIDTFFIFWKNKDIKVFHIEAYLAGIARNLIKEKFKKSNILYSIDDYENEIGLVDNIEIFSEKREKLDKLEIGYKALSSQEFEILTLFYYSGLEITDIAKRLNLTKTNVKTKLFRIRKKLKKYLD